MPVLEVYEELGVDGGCHLFTFDPPGLLAWGRSRGEALREAPGQAAALRGLLAEHGLLGVLKEAWEARETPELKVAETVRGRNQVSHGGTKATFARDLVPVSGDEIPGFLRWLAALRTTLWALRDRIPPEGYSFRSLPHRMTIEEQLRHIAGCDRWYLSRFWDNLPRLPRSRDVWHKLELNRGRALSMLGGMTAEDRARTLKTDHEVWSARKLFRRFAYHEKFHRDTIERDLALFLEREGA
ncbi:MAG: hypothetical protein AB1645_02915 [Bacillota bacterium]